MLVDGLRPLWLPTIAGVNGSPTCRVSEWISDGQYYFDSSVGSTKVSFICTPGSTLIEIFAAEMSRFSSAAIETSVGIMQPSTPKSTAWLFIQTYYAAFYAAHSILRSVGISATSFGASQCQKVDQIAGALGFSDQRLNAGQFRCEYSVSSGRLECNSAFGKGIHEQFWRVFDAFLNNACNIMLKNSVRPDSDAQSDFSKLNALRVILKSNRQSGGQWLSMMRNDVTYKHSHKAWYPYGRTKSECDQLFILQKEWLKQPDNIVLNTHETADVKTFVAACAFLVSLSVAVTKDMANRCPLGKSFLSRGPLKLLSQVSA